MSKCRNVFSNAPTDAVAMRAAVVEARGTVKEERNRHKADSPSPTYVRSFSASHTSTRVPRQGVGEALAGKAKRSKGKPGTSGKCTNGMCPNCYHRTCEKHMCGACCHCSAHPNKKQNKKQKKEAVGPKKISKK